MSTISEDSSIPFYTRTAASPVRSHQSYDPLVEAVCHHSGRYLRRDEIITGHINPFREQHDFPGFPELDALFQDAAHSYQHEHQLWSVPTLQGTALIAAGAATLVSALVLFSRINYYGSREEQIFFYAVFIIGGLLGALFLVWGISLIRRRTSIYHAAARNKQPPSTADFPLLGSYRIDLREQVSVDLSNERGKPPELGSTQGQLAIEVLPDERMLGWYNTYQTLYKPSPESLMVHAGAVALDNLRGVQFSTPIEYGHRIPLRQLAAQQFVDGTQATRRPLSFGAAYTLSPHALRVGGKPESNFVIEFLPELAPYDSRTLVVRFRWLGEPQLTCKLIECLLRFDIELDRVTAVEQGRYVRDGDTGEIVWRNLLFHDNELALRVTFEKPLLNQNTQHPLVLSGTYEIAVDGAVSGLQVRADHVWNALGRRADRPLGTNTNFYSTLPSIRSQSTVRGALQIDSRLLSQEHEFAASAVIQSPRPPNNELMQQVIKILTNQCDVDVQRIEHALPRIDPDSESRVQLRYWDILGRCYETSLLETIDVHVVMYGNITNRDEANNSFTQIDVRVRCLYDPRTTATRRCVEDTCASIAYSLKPLST